MNIQLISMDNKYLILQYSSKYSTGSASVTSPEDLVREIENICGKGSYCLYYRPKEFPFGYPKALDYADAQNYNLPTITYWQQGVKTGVIEQCRDVARKIWGDIDELKVGWLENMCRTYVD